MIQDTAKWLIITGVLIVIAGIILFLFGDKLTWFGRLPGDIHIEDENYVFYFPITTMLIVSAILSLIGYLVFK